MQPENEKCAVEDNLPALSNLIAEPVMIIDRIGKILAVNQGVKEAIGFSPIEIIGKSFSEIEFLDRENKAKLAKNLAQRMKGIDVEPYEIKVTSKDGKIKYFETRGKKINYYGDQVDLVVFHDITQRIQVQEHLESNLESKGRDLLKSEEKLRSIFESSPDPIIISDLNGNVTDCNPAALKAFEYSTKKEVIGKSFLDFIAKEDHLRAIDNLRITLEKGLAKNIVYSVLAKEGRKFPAELSVSVMRDSSGQPTGLVGIVTDITERKRSEEKLRSLAKFPSENPNPVIRIAKNNDILFANAAAKLLLMDLKVKVGQPALPQISKHVTDVMKSRKRKTVEVRHANRTYLFTFAPILDASYVNVYGVDITNSKEIEKSLKESEGKYSSLFANMMEGFAYCQMLFDEKGKPNDFVYLEVNDAFEELTGLKKDEVVGKKVTEAIPGIKEANPELFETYGRVALTGNAERLEIDFKPLKVWLSMSVYCPKKGYFVAVFDNVTERKRTEIAIAQSEEEHRMIFEEALDAIFLADAETGIIVDCNPAALEMLGKTKAEVVGEHQFSLHPAELITERFTKYFKEHVESPATIFETQVVTKSGDIRDVTVKAGVFELEGRKWIQGTFRDITEHKRMEQEVQASEEKFRAISNSVRDAIILVDNEAKIKYWNPAAEKTFGYTLEEALERSVHELVIPDSMCAEGWRNVKRGFEEFAKTGTGAFLDTKVELIGQRKDGTEFPTELSLSAIKLGSKWYAVGVAKDITERKQSEQIARDYAEKLEKAVATRTNELKAANDSLVRLERFAAIGELAGMVGHDLRNPLTGIKNAAYFLKKKGTSIPEADAKAMLEIIEKEINHSDKIINDLLDYAKEMHLDLKMRSLQKLLAEVLEMVDLPEKVKIINNVPIELEIRIDPNKMERVFINLIKNAIDAMPNGGTITIDCKQDNGNVEISFADSGVGIPEEILPKLFSPLFTTKAQGMGFGLAICKRIIEAHSGTITVETTKGKGTTFTITLAIEPKIENGGEKVWINLPEYSLSTMTKA